MGKEVTFKNHDRFIHLGIAIAALRKMRGMSQEQLAEKAEISRSLISAIEAPGLAKSFSLDVFFNFGSQIFQLRGRSGFEIISVQQSAQVCGSCQTAGFGIRDQLWASSAFSRRQILYGSSFIRSPFFRQ